MKVLQLVKGKCEFSLEDWIQVIEERRAIITAKLDDFTLPWLSNAEVVIPTFCHASMRAMRCSNKEIKLNLPTGMTGNDVQGWFGYSKAMANDAPHMEDQVCEVAGWGLDRTGKWMVVYWELTYKESGHHSEFDLQSAVITVREADLLTMLTASKERPDVVCARLSSIIYAWERRRKERLTEIEKIAAEFAKDDTVLSQICETHLSINWPQRGPLPSHQ